MDLVALSAMLERHEANERFPYDDATGLRLQAGDTIKGNVGIGVGRNLTAKGISPEESLTLLSDDIGEVLDDLENFAWWSDLSENRQLALADMHFNLGAHGFRGFKNMVHALAVKDYPAASRAMLDSQAARELPSRYKELAQMMEQG